MKSIWAALALPLMLAIASAHGADKVKVGFLSTLSGPGAGLGVDIQDGFKLALKSTGGMLGGLPAEMITRFGKRALTIPMPAGKVRSLNLATATGIALYEALRQLHRW